VRALQFSASSGECGLKLLRAAADHIANEHAKAEGEDQRRREVILHKILSIMRRVARKLTCTTPLAVCTENLNPDIVVMKFAKDRV
jgi:hypothetical protein